VADLGVGTYADEAALMALSSIPLARFTTVETIDAEEGDSGRK
jgi:hypothetical protein